MTADYHIRSGFKFRCVFFTLLKMTEVCTKTYLNFVPKQFYSPAAFFHSTQVQFLIANLHYHLCGIVSKD